MSQHAMEVMDPTGHTSVRWDPDNDDEVKAAEATFDAMKAKGYSAFRVEMAERRGARLDRFDPTAAKMILVPQLVGG